MKYKALKPKSNQAVAGFVEKAKGIVGNWDAANHQTTPGQADEIIATQAEFRMSLNYMPENRCADGVL